MRKKSFLLSLIFFFGLLVYAQPKIWNLKNIENARVSPTEASKAIIREADKNLATSLVTVVDKPMTPPSGDKHDYMSMGRYWWPNPNTSDGLPYVRKDGEVNPEIDKLDRIPLAKFTRNVYTLSLAFYLTGNNKYAAKAVDNLRIWFIEKNTKMNPNMNFGQTIPGHLNGKGRGEGILDTYSFVEMLDAIELLKKSATFTKNDRKALNDWFTEYLNWLQTSSIGKEEFEAKNNHGVAYDVQVARYALFVGNEEIAKQMINKFPERRLFKQIEPNGAQPLELARTTALGYSVFNISHFLDMCCIAKSLNIDLYNVKSADGRSISKAIDFLVPFVGKTVEDFPYKQIKEWDKVQKELCWQLYRADNFLPSPTYKNLYNTALSNLQKDNNALLY
ncbi:MAG: alginate lyase family protein [Paludibacter sp.]